mgnify:CR=1 FL=1
MAEGPAITITITDQYEKQIRLSLDPSTSVKELKECLAELENTRIKVNLVYDGKNLEKLRTSKFSK